MNTDNIQEFEAGMNLADQLLKSNQEPPGRMLTAFGCGIAALSISIEKNGGPSTDKVIDTLANFMKTLAKDMKTNMEKEPTDDQDPSV